MNALRRISVMISGRPQHPFSGRNVTPWDFHNMPLSLLLPFRHKIFTLGQVLSVPVDEWRRIRPRCMWNSKLKTYYVENLFRLFHLPSTTWYFGWHNFVQNVHRARHVCNMHVSTSFFSFLFQHNCKRIDNEHWNIRSSAFECFHSPFMSATAPFVV